MPCVARKGPKYCAVEQRQRRRRHPTMFKDPFDPKALLGAALQLRRRRTCRAEHGRLAAEGCRRARRRAATGSSMPPSCGPSSRSMPSAGCSSRRWARRRRWPPSPRCFRSALAREAFAQGGAPSSRRRSQPSPWPPPPSQEQAALGVNGTWRAGRRHRRSDSSASSPHRTASATAAFRARSRRGSPPQPQHHPTGVGIE